LQLYSHLAIVAVIVVVVGLAIEVVPSVVAGIVVEAIPAVMGGSVCWWGHEIHAVLADHHLLLLPDQSHRPTYKCGKDICHVESFQDCLATHEATAEAKSELGGFVRLGGVCIEHEEGERWHLQTKGKGRDANGNVTIGEVICRLDDL
jgi:hypothetical protein